jgi:rod shape determining protein RodA
MLPQKTACFSSRKAKSKSTKPFTCPFWSQRWLSLGPIGFQPSEFAKLSVILTVATYFASHRIERPYRLTDLWPIFGIVGVAFGLIFAQPDFGTAGICALIVLTQLIFLRIDLQSMVLTLVVSPLIGLVGWLFFLRPYQKLRILNLINPSFDPQNTGYNSLQSLIAVGSGGLWGKGYMQGTQAQLKFLPARHTDFIFSVFAEEHGFWGAALVFFLFGTLIYLALDIAREARDTFSGLTAIGIAALIFWEYIINIAMVLGLFPVVGVPLPFFSFGSSMLLTICMALGILVAIHRHTHLKRGQEQPKGKFIVVEKG